MSNPGMDQETFDAFIEQLRRYVRERLIPAEEAVIAADSIPDDILAEMRDMGLFGITIPEEFGGAGMNISQYIETVKQLSYAAPAYRSTMSINVGMTGSAIKNFGTTEQKAEWLPRIAAGEIACFGLTEGGARWQWLCFDRYQTLYHQRPACEDWPDHGADIERGVAQKCACLCLHHRYAKCRDKHRQN
jgi:alkylation response protein AidB-like acyl-CoA dehydrogenase